MPLDYTILAPSVVTKMVSRIATPGNTIQTFLGFQPGGKNVAQDTPDGVRSYSYDIFDNVRSIASGRAPGTGPSIVARNPVGKNTVTIARSYEKIPDLSYELLSNIRQLGAGASDLDRKGMRYLEAQAKCMAQRQVNFREFLAWGMLRGSCGFSFSGDNWVPVLSGGNITLDWKIPSGNKSQLNMLGGGDIIGTSWATTSTDIPGDLDDISAAFQELTGAPLAWCLTGSDVWNAVLNNTKVQSQAGTAQTAFELFDMTNEANEDGIKTGLRVARLRCRPWLTWLITDAGLEVNGSFRKFFTGGEISFGVDLNYGFAKMQEGSEYVKDNPFATPNLQRGTYSWLREWDEPARVELHSLSNLVPELTIPKGLAFADVIP